MGVPSFSMRTFRAVTGALVLTAAASSVAASTLQVRAHGAPLHGSSRAVAAHPAPAPTRSAEVLQSLTQGNSVARDGGERRRMSREERESLNEEWRQITRGAYDKPRIRRD